MAEEFEQLEQQMEDPDRVYMLVDAEEDQFVDSDSEKEMDDPECVEGMLPPRGELDNSTDFFNMEGDVDPEIEFVNQKGPSVIVDPPKKSAEELVKEKLKVDGIDIQSMVNNMVQEQLKRTLGDMYGKNDSVVQKSGELTEEGKQKMPVTPPNNAQMHSGHLIKSPSDTTLYAPLLCKGREQNSDKVIDQISNFVESIRMSQEEQGGSHQRGKKRKSVEEIENSKVLNSPAILRREKFRSERQDIGDKRRVEERDAVGVTANSVVNRMVVEAEKFRANINAPQGMSDGVNKEMLAHVLDNDDDFFHVSCHIESSLKEKIERGEFVELEKLLPRNKVATQTADKRMEWVTRDGMTYLAPVQDRDCKINSIRKWEQAFRVYAAIYSKANPGRASEIWGYVYTINTAASSYHWDNVAQYDFTFRQLMHEKPWRSWSKTYMQGWNISLRDPTGRNSTGHQIFQNNNNFSNTGSSNRCFGDWRDDCCWRFNKNRCKKNADACHFNHRCTYCGGWNHGFHNCRKHLGSGKFRRESPHERSRSPNKQNSKAHGSKNDLK